MVMFGNYFVNRLYFLYIRNLLGKFKNKQSEKMIQKNSAIMSVLK